jgi:hypothetical protein
MILPVAETALGLGYSQVDRGANAVLQSHLVQVRNASKWLRMHELESRKKRMTNTDASE